MSDYINSVLLCIAYAALAVTGAVMYYRHAVSIQDAKLRLREQEHRAKTIEHLRARGVEIDAKALGHATVGGRDGK